MPFTISIPQGTREGALKELQTAKALPEGSDQTQIEAVKALLASEISALDPKFNGVRISASGEAHAGGRTLQVTVIPLHVHL
jgi:hypothetical protein